MATAKKKWIIAAIVVLAFLYVPVLVFYVSNSRGNEHYRIKWTYRFEKSGWMLGLGPDGTVYVMENGPELVAIAPTGRVKWRYGLKVIPRRGESLQFLKDGTVCVMGRTGRVVALSPDGKLEWLFEPRHWEAPLHPPAPGGPDASIVASAGRILYGLSSEGELIWARVDYEPLSRIHSTPAGPDGTLYDAMQDKQGVRAISPDGSIRWEFDECGRASNISPNEEGDLLIEGLNGTYLVNADGIKLWSIGAIASTLFDGVWVEDQFIVGTRNNELVAYSSTGQKEWQVNLGKELFADVMPTTDGIYCIMMDTGKASHLRTMLNLPQPGNIAPQYYLVKVSHDGIMEWEEKIPFSLGWGNIQLSPSGVMYINSDNKTLYALEMKENNR